MIERAHLLNQKKEATITLIFSYNHILPGIKRAINWDIIVSSPPLGSGGNDFCVISQAGGSRSWGPRSGKS